LNHSRALASIAVPVAVFLATAAYLLVQGRASAPVRDVASEAPAPRASIPATPLSPAPFAVQHVARESDQLATRLPDSPIAHRTAAGVLPVSGPVTRDSSPYDPPVPVRFYAVSQPSPAGFLATLVNMSGDDLDVRVTGVSARTRMRSTVDLTLRPHQRASLTEAGLQVSTGDEVTVQSPGFSDLTVQVQ
jgi:hypothetical protein